MRAYDDDRSEETWRQRGSSFLDWLKRRPMESWGFFIAGVIIARILF